MTNIVRAGHAVAVPKPGRDEGPRQSHLSVYAPSFDNSRPKQLEIASDPHAYFGQRAFTLVELLVVLAIVAALAALSVPVFSRVAQNSRAAACMSNLRQLGAALQLYVNDHNMVMPTLAAARGDRTENAAVIDNTLNVYAANPKVFACPADTKGDAAASGTSYYWNSLLNGQSITNLHLLNLSTTNSLIPVLCDKDPFHPYVQSKVNMLYADGHTTSELTFADKK